MKTIANALCLLLMLFLAGTTVSAQKSFHSQDYEPVISNLPDGRILAGPVEKPVFSNDYYYIENNFRVEDWMTDTRQWIGSSAASYEAQISLEDWMYKSYTPQEIRVRELVKEDLEAPLKLEKWMYCCDEWKLVSVR